MTPRRPRDLEKTKEQGEVTAESEALRLSVLDPFYSSIQPSALILVYRPKQSSGSQPLGKKCAYKNCKYYINI